MVAEDDIDVESLQAQIDMSMSYAHNLVMSWIKPPHLSQLRSSNVNTSQIEEELRRPPRLGVGASIPAASSLSHMASKLKRRLEKDKVKRESVKEPHLQDFSKSDDDERKGRPNKRKTRADPFGHEGKRKRKDQSTAYHPHLHGNTSKSSDPLPKSALAELVKHDSSGKAMQGMGSGDQQPCMPKVQPSAGRNAQISQSITAVPSLVQPPRETSAPVPGNATTLVQMPNMARPLAIPLLNLDGPPGLADKLNGNSEFDRIKNKRKRRKRKKKNQTITGTADN